MMCTVSASSRAPGWVTSGRSVKSCGRFHGERLFKSPRRLRVRCTLGRLTKMPSRLSSWYMCWPQRLRPILFAMIASTISLLRAFGLVFGRDDRVGNWCQPVAKGNRHQRDIVDGSTPNFRATSRIDRISYFTSLTASLRTFAICGFVVYAIYVF
jgi:hypothetical protein